MEPNRSTSIVHVGGTVNIVRKVNTPEEMDSILANVRLGFQGRNYPITETQVRNLAVLVAIETGQGAKEMNFNPGNISASEKYDGDAWRPPWFDPAPDASPRIRRLHRLMLQGKAPRAFRSYPTRFAGYDDFARLIIRSYPSILRAADMEDPVALQQAIGRSGYSTDYLRAEVVDTIERLQRQVGLNPRRSSAPMLALGGIGGLVAILVLGFVLAKRR